MTVDAIVGIEEYEKKWIKGASGTEGLLSGVVEANSGKLVMLLEPARLLSGKTAELVRRSAPARRQQDNRVEDIARSCLSVSIGNQAFAIPLDKVSRVLQYKSFEKIQDHRERVIGAIDVEGRVVPVIQMQMNAADSVPIEWKEYVIIETRGGDYAIAL